jgi:16S rRNA (guanine1516-N2)-methyltransferase
MTRVRVDEEAIDVESGSSSGRGAAVFARDVVTHAALIRELGIDTRIEPPDDAFLLVEVDGRLELRPPGEASVPGVRSNFPPDQRASGSRRNPLVRAFGRKLEAIFDLTAGFGADAYRLAEAGHHVLACERDPAVYAVLASGWLRDRSADHVPEAVAARLGFRHAEGIEMLRGIDRLDVGVYLDPMYPQLRRTKALPKRELQVLRRLHPELADASPLLEEARARAARVVVKRPHRAPPLASGVGFEIVSKLVRFDVYVNPDRMSAGSSATPDADEGST